MIEIALDLESTLADIETPFVNHYNEDHRETITTESWGEWDFSDAPFEAREFMQITGHNWKENANEIHPIEQGIAQRVFRVYQEADKLDIVTNRVGHETTMNAWLNTQGIQFDNFVSTQNVKTDLNYDVYIDDHPNIANHLNPSQHLFLYDQAYNQDVNTSPLNIERISSVSDVSMNP